MKKSIIYASWTMLFLAILSMNTVLHNTGQEENASDLTLSSLEIEPYSVMAEDGGCGGCWQNGVQSVSWGFTWYILCNCDSRKGTAGNDCVCN